MFFLLLEVALADEFWICREDLAPLVRIYWRAAQHEAARFFISGKCIATQEFQVGKRKRADIRSPLPFLFGPPGIFHIDLDICESFPGQERLFFVNAFPLVLAEFPDGGVAQ